MGGRIGGGRSRRIINDISRPKCSSISNGIVGEADLDVLQHSFNRQSRTRHPCKWVYFLVRT